MYFTYFAMILVALVYGLLVAFTDWLGLLLFAPILPIIGILLDYRVGVVLLMILMPLYAYIPSFHGFNIITYLIVATSLSLCATAYSRRYDINLLPKWLWWSYLLPVTWAALIGLGHLHEVPIQMILLTNFQTKPYDYLTTYFVKPMYLVFATWMLAFAVAHSKKPERFIAVFVFIATLSSLIIIIFTLKSGIALSALAKSTERGFLSDLGMHSNQIGMMLALGLGPLLFLLPVVRSPWARFAMLLALGSVFGGILLTFTRGAYVAVLVILVFFYLTRKNKALSTAIAVTGLLLGSLLIPNAVIERSSQGMDSNSASSINNRSDKLTAGRVAVWIGLFPDVFKHPVIGGGLESTTWSEGVRYGWIPYTHPHNLYLRILLDTGIIGLVLILNFYRRLFLCFYHAPCAPPLFRAFFQGMAASLVGYLVDGFTNGSFAPSIEHSFLWFAFGISLGMAKLTQPGDVLHSGKSLVLPPNGGAYPGNGNGRKH